MSALVLTVDDDFAFLEAVTLLLEGEGFRVRKAGDGEVALARMLEEAPDLVVCDVMMPALDGAALVRRMAEDPRLRAIPVILMTAAPALRADLPACAAVLAKPFFCDTLRDTVRRVLGGRARG